MSRTVSWVKTNLADPSSIFHAVGLALIVGEVVRHWISGHPVDLGAVGAGSSLIFGGITSDRLGVAGARGITPGPA